MPHGTAYSFGQYNQVLTDLIKALPPALDGIDPKHLLKVLQAEGERFGKKLGETFEEFLDEFPFSYYQAMDHGLELLDDVVPLGNREDYLRLEIVNLCSELTDSQEIPQRARDLGANLGQKDAERLLKNHEDLLRATHALRNHNSILFPGTVWGTSISSREHYYTQFVPHIFQPKDGGKCQIGLQPLVGQMRGFEAYRVRPLRNTQNKKGEQK